MLSKKSTTGLIMVITVVCVEAQNFNFQPGVEIRPRIIFDGGYQTPKTDTTKIQVYLSQRTRLNADFSCEKLRAYVSLQDVRIWGDDNNYKETGTLGNTESLSLHQGWFTVSFNKSLSLKAGRQILAYDDQRIFSARNWNDYQVSYDALLLKYEKSRNRVDLGLSWNAQNAKVPSYPENKIKLFDFIRYERQFRDYTVSGLGLITGNSTSDTSDRIYLRATWGLNIIYLKNNFQARISAYYQHHLNKAGEKLSAVCFSVFLKKRILTEKIWASACLDFLSGNKDDSVKTNHRFDIFYGTRHRYYGSMDYFNQIPEQGLQDYWLSAGMKPLEKLDLQITYHYFLFAADQRNPQNNLQLENSFLGQEIDFAFTWKPVEQMTIEAGYSVFLVTDTLKALKGVAGQSTRIPQFAWTMVTVKL